jgi:hypothetical protein
MSPKTFRKMVVSPKIPRVMCGRLTVKGSKYDIWSMVTVKHTPLGAFPKPSPDWSYSKKPAIVREHLVEVIQPWYFLKEVIVNYSSLN